MASSSPIVLTPNERNGIREIVRQLAAGLQNQGLSSSIILDEIDDMISRISRQRHRINSRNHIAHSVPLAANRTPRPTRDSALMSIEDARKVNHRLVTRILSPMLWTRIFSLLPLIDLVSSSHVCDDWRTLILLTPRLWEHLVNLSGGAVDGLAVFLTRSKAVPVQIELNADLTKMQDPAGLFIALGGHIWHTVSLELSFSTMAEHQILQLQSALSKEAPLLRRLCIFSSPDTRIRLLPDLFSRYSPHLTDVTLPIPSLPEHCDALKGVVSFTSASPASVDVTHHEARRVFLLCPALKDFTLNSPLKYPIHQKGTPYVISTIVDGPLASLSVPEILASTIPFTLRTLNYETIGRITIPHVSFETAQFIRKRMPQPVDHLTFVRTHIDAHIILIDAKGSHRIFPSTSHLVLDELLKSDQLLTGLTSLALPDFLRPTDISLLCGLASFARLTSLTIFVGLVPQSYTFQEIYGIADEYDTLSCLALRTLRLSAFTPPCMDWSNSEADHQFREDACVSIQNIVSFIQATLGFSILNKLRRLILDKVQLLPEGDKTLTDLHSLVDEVTM